MTGPLDSIDQPTLLSDVLQDAPTVRWIIAKVVSLQLAQKSVTVDIRGTSVPKISYPKGHEPAVNDVVHILAHPDNGMMIVAIEELSPAVTPPTPASPSTVAATSAASFVYDPVPLWVPGLPLVQNATSGGAFFYAGTPFAAYSGVTMAKLEIQVQMSTTQNGPLALTLHANTGTGSPYQPIGSTYLYQPDTAVPGLQWIRLPLSWAGQLASGTAKGVGLTRSTYQSTVSAGGTLRFTPLL